MSVVTLSGRLAGALALVVLSSLQGCASKSGLVATDEPAGYAGVVSAREYGYVRPASDVSVAGRGRLITGASKGDVWGRVRSGMRLNLHADNRIDATLGHFRRDPRYLQKLSRRASPYLPLIIAEIERRGLPMELALLPHVESRYNPAATSPKAAAGMWQFMPYTAREMGLRLDGERDERRDVAASTRAALDYLEQLNRRFAGDWELAMAAYNCGPGRVESAQAANRRRGKPTDFWSLDLPAETESYVPQILATARLVAEGPSHGQHLTPLPDRLTSGQGSARVAVRLHERGSTRTGDGTVHVVRSKESLASVALRFGVDLAALAEANGMSVRDPLLPGQTLFIPAQDQADVITHHVRKGESIAAVARRYGVTSAEVRRWNNLADNRIAPGETLKIHRRA